MIKHNFKSAILTSLAAMLLPLVSSAAVSYARTPGGRSVRQPLTVSFSFEDWSTEMDFTDVFGQQQNYWWLEVDSEEEFFSSDCYASTTPSATAVFDLPAGDYFAVSANAAATLAACRDAYGGSRYRESRPSGLPLFKVVIPGAMRPPAAPRQVRTSP